MPDEDKTISGSLVSDLRNLMTSRAQTLKISIITIMSFCCSSLVILITLKVVFIFNMQCRDRGDHFKVIRAKKSGQYKLKNLMVKHSPE